NLAGLIVVDDGPGGNGNFEVFTIAAVPVASLTVAAGLGTEHVIVAKFEKRIFVDVGNEIDVSAIAPIAAAGTALRHELFPSERDAAVPTVTGLDRDFGLIDEHGLKTHRVIRGRRPSFLYFRNSVSVPELPCVFYSRAWIEINRPVRPLSSNCTIPGIFAKSVSSLPMPTLTPGLNSVPRSRTR